MAKPTLVTSNAELHAATAWFDALIRNEYSRFNNHEKSVISNSFAHARVWIAYPDAENGFVIGFSKIVGHPSIKSISEYDKWRVKISGSETERAIKSFGNGSEFAVGSAATGKRHPAAEKAVLNFCKIAGKTPNSLAVVRVMPVPDTSKSQTLERTIAYEVVLAALRAANLSTAERERLLVESVA